MSTVHTDIDMKYLLLTEFEGCNVSYRTNLFPHRFMAQGRSEKVINGGEKLRFVTYSMDQENKVSKIYLLYLYCVSDGFWNVFYSRRMASN